ncbi:hypothetical protein MMC28_007011 [Mycoblastus sanguinarius]|nr:hypothetical protein [Mycoblastus sanguinarius]
MPRGREAVLVRFDPLTTKQYRVYAPDLRRVIKASSVVFDENTPGGEIDLNLKTNTPNILPTRKPVGRPKLDTGSIPVTNPFPTTDNQGESEPKYQGESVPITRSRPQGGSIPVTRIPTTESKMIAVKIPIEPQPLEIPAEIPAIKFPATPLATIESKTVAEKLDKKPDIPSPMHSLKRRRDSEPSDERIIKHLRSQLAIAMGAIEIEQESDQQQGPVPIPRIYQEAIDDPIHGKHWAKAFLAEIRALELNKT